MKRAMEVMVWFYENFNNFSQAEYSSKERPAVRREQLAFKEGRPTLKKTQSPEHHTTKKKRSTLEDLPSAFKEELSTLKEKRPITRKARSPSKMERSTIEEEPPTLEKEVPTLFDYFVRRFYPRASRGEPIPPEEPDLPLPEENVGGPSQVGHPFSTNSRLNK